jgi:hypothetical protein
MPLVLGRTGWLRCWSEGHPDGSRVPVLATIINYGGEADELTAVTNPWPVHHNGEVAVARAAAAGLNTRADGRRARRAGTTRGPAGRRQGGHA